MFLSMNSIYKGPEADKDSGHQDPGLVSVSLSLSQFPIREIGRGCYASEQGIFSPIIKGSMTA